MSCENFVNELSALAEALDLGLGAGLVLLVWACSALTDSEASPIRSGISMTPNADTAKTAITAALTTFKSFLFDSAIRPKLPRLLELVNFTYEPRSHSVMNITERFQPCRAVFAWCLLFDIAMKSAAEQRHLRARRGDSLPNRFLDHLSSVRFGIILLIILILLSTLGMLVMQQNIDGFDRYISEMPEERRALFATLGLFDIYRSWYFTAALILLSVNIVLASIERLPLALRYIRRPKTKASDAWISTRETSSRFATLLDTDEAIGEISSCVRRRFAKNIIVSGDHRRRVIFAERGRSNRLGAYAVHISLLIVFTGGFLTANFSYSGKMNLSPGMRSNQIVESAYQIEGMNQARRTLPFEIICTDIEQVLVRESEGLGNGNTIDWITRFAIDEDGGRFAGEVGMNRPFDHRGFRFFQSSYIEIPRARSIQLSFARADGGTESIRIERDGSAKLRSGAEIRFTGFDADGGFRDVGASETDVVYPDPVAILSIKAQGMAERSIVASMRGGSVIEGIGEISLTDFERVSETHVLSIQYDPGANLVYAGFVLLGLSLVWVFTTGHQRIWISIAPSDRGSVILIGGDSNRSYAGIETVIKDISNNLNIAHRDE